MADPRLERLEGLKRLAALRHKADQVRTRESASKPTDFEQEAQSLLNVSVPELIMGAAPTRFAMGAAAPFLAFGQHMGNMVDTAGAAFGWNPEVGQRINELLQSAKSMKERGMEAYGQEGVDLSGIAGEVMSPVGLKAMKLLKPAATAIRRAGQGSVIGAGYGAATPVMDAENLSDYWEQKAGQIGGGALFGAVLPAGIDLAKVPLKAVYHAVEPFLPGGIDRVIRRTLQQAAGPRREEVLKELAKRKGVSLSQLQTMQTAGDAVSGAGSAELSALQKIVEQLRPSEYQALDRARNQARVNALHRIAKNPEQLATALGDRAAKAAEMYGQAFEQQVPKALSVTKKGQLRVLDKDLKAIMSDPYVAGVMGDAKKLMSSYKVKISDRPIQFLHSLKLTIDKQLRKQGPDALDHAERAQLLKRKRELVAWLEDKVPQYGTARAEFASRSIPINQMQVGQFLLNKLKPVLSDVGVDANQRAAAFVGALRDAPGTIKNSTNSQIYSKLEQILNPDQMRILSDVGADLGSRAQYRELARAGSPAARELVNTVRQEWRSPNPLHRGLMIFNQLLGRLQGKASKETLEALATRFQKPGEIERFLQEMPPGMRRRLIQSAAGFARRGLDKVPMARNLMVDDPESAAMLMQMLRRPVTIGTPTAGYSQEF